MERLLKISEFATLSGISRKLLIFYDRQGIFSPQRVDPRNGYRYYSYHQLDSAYTIVCLREAGVSLEQIKGYLAEQSPQHLTNILQEQERCLTQQIQKLENIRSMVRSCLERLEEEESATASAALPKALADIRIS